MACWTPLEGVIPYQPVTGSNSHGMFAASRKLLTGADVDIVAVGDPISSFNTDVSSPSARNDLTTLGLSPLHTSVPVCVCVRVWSLLVGTLFFFSADTLS